jgi:protein-tyrosine phosphatase
MFILPGHLEYTQIHNNLFQGSCPTIGDDVRDAGFDVLVLCAEEIQDSESYNVDYVIKAPGADTLHLLYVPDEAVMNWTTAAAEVVGHLKAGRKVLVTCQAGLNRSGFVTAVALHKLTGWDGAKCVQHVQHTRQGALFNKSFVRWIQNHCREY